MSKLHLGPPRVNGAATRPHAHRRSATAPVATPDAAALYRAMVAAVRAWAHAVHPAARAIDICKMDERAGQGEVVASFHALNPADAYSRGDLMAGGG